jgi:hypothetical protein
MLSSSSTLYRTLGVVIVGLAACKPADATPPDFPAAVAEARRAGEELDKERREALVKAASTIVPRADLGRCPVEVKLPGLQFKAIMPNQVAISMATAKPGLDVLTMSEAETKPGPTLGLQKIKLDILAGEAKRGYPDVVARAREMGTPGWFDVDLVVVSIARTDPEIVGSDKFKSGELIGRAYLWSYKEHTVLCAATVTVESSDTVDVAGGSPEYLRGDLDAQAILQAKERLVRAGPKGEARPASSPSGQPSTGVSPNKPIK